MLETQALVDVSPATGLAYLLATPVAAVSAVAAAGAGTRLITRFVTAPSVRQEKSDRR